jgi:hypothetical protein
VPYATDVFTYFTPANGQTQLVFSANDTDWVDIIMNLETAGPVAFGTKQDLSPVASGKGRLLPTGVDVHLTLPPAGRLYMVSTTVNRVAMQVSPYPWLRDILEAERAAIKPPAAPGSSAPKPTGPGVDIGKFGWQGKLPGAK